MLNTSNIQVNLNEKNHHTANFALTLLYNSIMIISTRIFFQDHTNKKFISKEKCQAKHTTEAIKIILAFYAMNFGSLGQKFSPAKWSKSHFNRKLIVCCEVTKWNWSMYLLSFPSSCHLRLRNFGCQNEIAWICWINSRNNSCPYYRVWSSSSLKREIV